MGFNEWDDICTLNGRSLKLVDKFTNLGNSVSSTENDINTWWLNAWTAIYRLSVIWKSDLSDKIKLSFFQAAVISILLYGCTTWTLAKPMLDGSCTRMLQAVLNKSWRQHPTKQQLYRHLLPISKTIQTRWARHVGHCWINKDKLISNVLLWTLSHRCARVVWPAITYLQQLCSDTGCRMEDLLRAIDDRDEWWERVMEIRASGTPWWWLFFYTFSSPKWE